MSLKKKLSTAELDLIWYLSYHFGMQKMSMRKPYIAVVRWKVGTKSTLAQKFRLACMTCICNLANSQNGCCIQFCKIHRKTLITDSFFSIIKKKVYRLIEKEHRHRSFNSGKLFITTAVAFD